jgi:hypothetical protein
MATIRYEVKAKNGSYKDRNGEEKVRWHHMGVCFQNDKGQLSLKIDSLPLNWDGWVSLFEPKPKDGQQASAPSAPANTITDDDIPF